MKKTLLSALMIGSVALTGLIAPNMASANALAGGASYSEPPAAQTTYTDYNQNYNTYDANAVNTQAALPSTGSYDYNYSAPQENQTTSLASNSTATTTPVATSSGTGSAVVAEAMKYIGTPYVWGAKGPDAFDCSGFTHYVYQQATGREIGGWTVPQESAGTQISVDQAQAGDLLFWGTPGASYHVAISLGGGQYIQAPAPGQSVSISSTAYFAPSFAVRM